MIVITPAEIRTIVATALPDAIITAYINAVVSRIGACLEASYDAETAKLIAMNLVAYFVAIASGGDGKKTSQSAPNGASFSVATTVTKSGLRSNPYGDLVYLLDINGCWQKMVASNILFECVGH